LDITVLEPWCYRDSIVIVTGTSFPVSSYRFDREDSQSQVVFLIGGNHEEVKDLTRAFR